MATLIVDNYDSFTWNLYQVIGSVSGDAPHVVRNDEIDLEGIRALAPDRIVLSPGPGSPDKPRDFGVCGPIITQLAGQLPILGVCLGHQGIIHHLGGRVARAPEIVHGKTWRVRRLGESRLFHGLPAELTVMRYHSLVGVRDTVPAGLRITCETIDRGLVMAVEHETFPLFGVQFHPESIGTPDGAKILRNFLEVR